MNLTIDITGYCNMKCVYCYQKCKGELNAEFVGSCVDKYKPDLLNIGGGEPLMHPEIKKIIDENHKKVDRINIATNATLITYHNYEFLKKENVSLQISLPSVRRECYTLITGNDLLGLVLGNIDSLLERGIDCSVNTVLTKFNIGTIPEIVNYAKKRNLTIILSPAHPCRTGDFYLNEAELIGARDAIISQKVSYDRIESPLLHELSCSSLKRIYSFFSVCPLENNNLYINPAGKIMKCEFTEEKSFEQ